MTPGALYFAVVKRFAPPPPPKSMGTELYSSSKVVGSRDQFPLSLSLVNKINSFAYARVELSRYIVVLYLSLET